MKPVVILNPAAGAGLAGRRRAQILARIGDTVGPVEVRTTERRAHATELARAAWQRGHREFLIVGGDGTVNEVVNGLPIDAEPGAALLGIVDCGTGGDFRRTLGIGDGLDASLDRIRTGAVRAIDVGKVSFRADDGSDDQRFFVNIASFGLSGVNDRRVNRAGAAKRLGSAFLQVTLVSAFLGYRFPSVRLIADGGAPIDARIMTVAVANGRYFGKGMLFAPGADPADGLFDLVISRGRNKAAMLRDMGAFRRGEHVHRPGVEVLRARDVVAEPADQERVLLDIDGESPGGLPCRFELLPRALRVRC
jgi:YegS/Rv2252/BmrU family lipid kinase